MDSLIDEYAKEVPAAIRNIFKSLSDDQKIGLLVGLLKHGDRTFNELKRDFNLHPTSLNRHLKALEKANLIENYYGKERKRIKSFYRVTDLSELLFESLFDILSEPRKTSKIPDSNLPISEFEYPQLNILPEEISNKISELTDLANKFSSRPSTKPIKNKASK